MDRREAIRRLGMLVGGALSAPIAAGLLGGCRAESGAYEYAVFSDGQGSIVREIADIIIPDTDTPGAAAAGVDVFIDKMLDRWFAPDDRERFLSGLGELEAEYRDGSSEERLALLRRLDAEGVAARMEGAEPLPFFATMKELTLVGYYTSEIGAAEELQYVMMPGRYDGDVPVSEVGRAYSRCNVHN